MEFSRFGRRFTGDSGILQLMADLGEGLAAGEDAIMLGGGNPAYIPQMQARLRDAMLRVMERPGEFERMVGDYSSPQGHVGFIDALAGLLHQQYGWPIGPENIVLTNGSQTAFFFLFNLLAGRFENGRRKKILLPLAPEYIGYADVGVDGDIFVANRPDIEFIDEHTFKYHVNFDSLEVTEDIGAICVSRPTNPTGNVLSTEEVHELAALAAVHDIPLILDNAYGLPFPAITFVDAEPVWTDHTILCMSLSKLGLPAARTGIVIGSPAVVKALSAMNAIVSLAPGSMGAALVADLVRTGEIIHLSRDLIRPFYQRKSEQAIQWLREAMGELPCYIHKSEGAFFLWLWFKDMPISSAELYRRLKARSVIIVPGHYFFPGLHEEWRHKHECIRMNFAQEEHIVRKGIHIIAEEVRRAYAGG
jgi:valine--pyruvate aminotransferase